jgi:hypothetical protein
MDFGSPQYASRRPPPQGFAQPPPSGGPQSHTYSHQQQQQQQQRESEMENLLNNPDAQKALAELLATPDVLRELSRQV